MSLGSKNKLYIFIIAILLLANIAMLVFFVWMKGPSRKGPHNDRPGNPVSEVLQKKVGFTDAQMGQYEQLKQQHWKQMRPLFDSMRKAKEQFYDHLDDEVISDTSMARLSESIGERQAAMDRQIFKHFRNLRELCTPGQKPGFDSLMKGIVQKMIVPGRRGGRQDKDNAKKDSLPK